jgi:general secretion pathway protein H
VRWLPVRDARTDDQFRFIGLPPQITLPTHWLGEPLAVQIAGNATAIRLGPEPLIGAQRLTLQLGAERVELVTDGLSAFSVQQIAAP